LRTTLLDRNFIIPSERLLPETVHLEYRWQCRAQHLVHVE
jgi:hypothetical protein